MKKEMVWKEVSDTFSERQRHYKDLYLEVCYIFDDYLEVSLFSSSTSPYEIYVSYGSMYGIVYTDVDNGFQLLETIKQDIAGEYLKNKQVTNSYIDYFAKTYGIQLPADTIFNMN